MLQNFHLHQLHLSELVRFNISVFIKIIGRSLIGVFIPIYLYTNGFSIFDILLFQLIISLTFILLAPYGAKLISKIGEKHAMIVASFFEIVFFLLIRFLPEYTWLLYVLPIFFGIEMILYNISYHLVFTQNSHEKNRGSEVANIGILVVLAGIISPYIGGLIAGFNFSILFTVSAGLILLSSIPLLITKDSKDKITFSTNNIWRNIFKKSELKNTISFSAYGIEQIIHVIIWPLIIISLVGSLERTGLAVSISAILSLLAYKIIGRFTDKHSKKKMITIGTYLHSAAWFMRLFVNSFYGIIFVDSYKNIAQKILHIPWSAQFYTLSLRSDFFEFIVRKEIIFHLSRICIYILLAIIFWINYIPFTLTIIVAAIASLGYKYIQTQ